MHEQIFNQARRVVNNDLATARKRLDDAEHASTELASLQIRDAAIPVQVFVYDLDHGEREFAMDIYNLRQVWAKLLAQDPYLKPDDVDITCRLADSEFSFESEDVEVAYNEAKGLVPVESEEEEEDGTETDGPTGF